MTIISISYGYEEDEVDVYKVSEVDSIRYRDGKTIKEIGTECVADEIFDQHMYMVVSTKDNVERAYDTYVSGIEFREEE